MSACGVEMQHLVFLPCSTIQQGRLQFAVIFIDLIEAAIPLYIH